MTVVCEAGVWVARLFYMVFRRFSKWGKWKARETGGGDRFTNKKMGGVK